MSFHKRILALVLAAVLALTAFPFTASATGEDVLEPAPEVVLPEEMPVPETDTEGGSTPVTVWSDEPVTEYTFYENPYLPFRYGPGYLYTGDAEETDDPWYMGPYLEPSEYQRAMELLAAVEAGDVSPEEISCLPKEGEMKIGVYPLDPGDFCGETFYVLLPDRKLEDNDLLYLISCFRELGIPFEPKEWTSRNCRRGSYVNGATRSLSEEENIRMDALRHQTANGILTEADIHPETQCRHILTQYGPFCFYPYRCLTDDELAAFALVIDPAWPNAPDEVEKEARKYLTDLIDLPMSMKLTETELTRVAYTNKVEGYELAFRIDYTDADGIILRTDGKPCEARAYLRRRAGDGAVVPFTGFVSFYSDYSVLDGKENVEHPLSKEEAFEAGKQWLLDNLALEESRFAWWVGEAEYGNDYPVWAQNHDMSFCAAVYPDGSVERLSIRSLDVRGKFVGDPDAEEAGTQGISLEGLLEQATQVPPEETVRPAETVPVPADLSGKIAWEAFCPSEDPYIPDYSAPDYGHLERADGDMMYYRSWLEPEELARANALEAAVEAGEKSLEGLSYPEHPEELKAGVYPLDPADFDGETYYVTLPGRKLKDLDLLYLISCFKQLGIPFEPENWNSRNCQRGYYSRGSARDLTDEEEARMAPLLDRVRRGTLTEKDVYPEPVCRSIDTCFGPLCFYPYRQMTDEELAAFALIRERTWDDDPDTVEEAARSFAAEIISLPASMELAIPERFMIPYSDRTDGYGMTFRISYMNEEGKLLQTDDEPCEVYVYLRKRQDNGALWGSMIRVDYYSDYNLLFSKEAAEPLPGEKLLETGKQWYRDNLSFAGDSYTYDIQKVEWGNFWWVWAYPADFSWTYNVNVYPDGSIMSFGAQRMEEGGY